MLEIFPIKLARYTILWLTKHEVILILKGCGSHILCKPQEHFSCLLLKLHQKSQTMILNWSDYCLQSESVRW